MIARANGVRSALFAVLLSAPCLAQETPPASPSPTASPAPATSPNPAAPPTTSTPASASEPASTSPAPAVAPKARAASKSVAGRGGVGGLIGGSLFYSSKEYSQGALPRFDFSGQFRYIIRPGLRMQMSPGLTWSAYSKNDPPPFTDPAFPGDKTKENYLAILVPVSAQLQLVWGHDLWLYHVGAGPGVYRLWVENHRKVLIDPLSLRLHRGPYWGTTAEVGVEHFLKTLTNTSIEVSAAHHYVFSTRDDQFPTGWNSTLGAIALRVGTNYYFDLNKPKKTSDLPLPGGH